MSKDIWFQEYERLLNAGLSEDDACEAAMDAMRDRIAYMMDHARDLKKEGKL